MFVITSRDRLILAEACLSLPTLKGHAQMCSSTTFVFKTAINVGSQRHSCAIIIVESASWGARVNPAKKMCSQTLNQTAMKRNLARNRPFFCLTKLLHKPVGARFLKGHIFSYIDILASMEETNQKMSVVIQSQRAESKRENAKWIRSSWGEH